MRDYIIEAAKADYHNSDVAMSEYLRKCDLDLTVEEERYLLTWAGDDEFMAIADNGEIVEK